MRLKRVILMMLIGVNLLLMMALFIQVDPTPQAKAQAGGAGGGRGYLCATAAAAGLDCEVLYIADLGGRKLYYFAPTNPQTRALEYLGVRDLKTDFRNEGTKP